MARFYYFVVTSGNGWAVHTGAGSPRREFTTQADAVAYAARTANTDHVLQGRPTGVRIQGRDSQWRDERSYGDDPFPPRG